MGSSASITEDPCRFTAKAARSPVDIAPGTGMRDVNAPLPEPHELRSKQDLLKDHQQRPQNFDSSGEPQSKLSGASGTSIPCPDPGCGKAFHSSSLFDRHMDQNRQHARPFGCPSCKRTFKRKPEVNRHHEEVHQLQWFKCYYTPCGYKTPRPGKRREHMEARHGWTDELSESEVKAMCTEPGTEEGTRPENVRPYEPYLNNLDVHTNNPSAMEPATTDNIAFDRVSSKFFDASGGLVFDPVSCTYEMPENIVEKDSDWSQKPPAFHVSAMVGDAPPPANTPPPVDKPSPPRPDDSDDLEFIASRPIPKY